MRAGKDPVDVIIDLALAKHLKQFFLQPLANENQDHVLEMMRHPRSVVTFSDSGAHVSQIMDSSLQTPCAEPLGAREAGVHAGRSDSDADLRAGLELGPAGRGLLREGWAADVIVFDPETNRADAADARSRSAGGRAAPEAEGDRAQGDHRQRRRCCSQQRAYRRAAGSVAARTASRSRLIGEVTVI